MAYLPVSIAHTMVYCCSSLPSLCPLYSPFTSCLYYLYVSSMSRRYPVHVPSMFCQCTLLRHLSLAEPPSLICSNSLSNTQEPSP